jgi:Ca2+-binding RTX toxin-like protein
VTSLKVDAGAWTAAQKVSVTGTAGNDTFIGGAGNDSFISGGGADLFNLTAGGHDQITGFDAASDVISLLGWAVHSFAGLAPFIHASGSASIINVDATHQITLNSLAPASLIAADFLFN